MRRRVNRTTVIPIALGLSAALACTAACETLSEAAADGEITASEIASGASSSNSDGTSNERDRQSTGGGAAGSVEVSARAGAGSSTSAPDRQKEWSTIRENISILDGDISVSSGPDAQVVLDGQPRCRWVDYQATRDHEGGGKYSPPDYWEPYRWPMETIQCSEVESVDSDPSAMALFEDDDTVVAAEWTTDWGMKYEHGNPVEKVRRVRAYHRRSDAIERAVPTPSREQLGVLAGKAGRDFVKGAEHLGRAEPINRIQSMQISPELTYRVGDMMDGSGAELVAEITELHFSHTHMTADGPGATEKYVCRDGVSLRISLADDDSEHTHTIDGTELNPGIRYTEDDGSYHWGVDRFMDHCTRK